MYMYVIVDIEIASPVCTHQWREGGREGGRERETDRQRERNKKKLTMKILMCTPNFPH